MPIHVLASRFRDGFSAAFAMEMQSFITPKRGIAFVASGFCQYPLSKTAKA